MPSKPEAPPNPSMPDDEKLNAELLLVLLLLLFELVLAAAGLGGGRAWRLGLGEWWRGRLWAWARARRLEEDEPDARVASKTGNVARAEGLKPLKYLWPNARLAEVRLVGSRCRSWQMRSTTSPATPRERSSFSKRQRYPLRASPRTCFVTGNLVAARHLAW